MKLCVGPRAPNPRRVLWTMAEKGIDDIEIVNLDLFNGEHRDPARLEKIGFSHVPSLELDDGTIITESVAICRYLESIYPEPNLFGFDAREVAVIEMWSRRAELLFANPLMMSVRYGHPAFAALGPQPTEVAAFNRSAADGGLTWLDNQLGKQAFIAGPRLTIADIICITGIEFARLTRFTVTDEFPNVQRWRSEMCARGAAKAGM
jgi:glutathione S-transferase